MKDKQIIGSRGEKIAAEFLEEKGYTIIARNVHTPHGEIDLIAKMKTEKNSQTGDSSTLIVFVEVKTRTTKTFGPPEESVTVRKQAHLLASVEYYIQQNPEPDSDWRIDVIAIEESPSKHKPRIVHFENALPA